MRRLLRALSPLALAVVLLAVWGWPEPSSTPPLPRPVDSTPPPLPSAAGPIALRLVVLPPPAASSFRNEPAEPPKSDPAPESAPAPPVTPVVRPSRSDAGRGHLMLDRIEKGEGPSIEIAWPEDPAARRRLVRYLERCADWRVLLLADRRLWRMAEPAGESWTPAASAAPSGLLRELDGPAADAATAAAIRGRHGLTGGRLVATVARRWDVKLLGGLDRLLTANAGAGEIRARYAVDAGRLSVADIRLSGRPVQGRVDLGPVSGCDG